jgi:hypothetical protein
MRRTHRVAGIVAAGALLAIMAGTPAIAGDARESGGAASAGAERAAKRSSPVERAGPPAPAATAPVRLTIQEREGIARKDEVVVTGVPLPEGAVKDAGELTILDGGGKPVFAEIRPVVKWPDGSVRWVHLYFRADCPADGATAVTLSRGERPARESRLRATDSPDAVTVVTGPLKFVVRKKGFNLIDAAWVDESGQGRFDAERQVVAPHRGGAVAKVDRQSYAAVDDADSQVAIEESGPMHVVIKATGAHKNEKGGKQLDYVARLYACEGSPVVRLVYTFVNAQGTNRQVPMILESLHLDLPTTVKQGRALVGATGGAKSATLGADAEAFAFASDSDTIGYGGAVEGTEKGKDGKPTSPGWVDLSDGRKGLAVGLRWFWQMHPKTVEVSGDGRLRMGLYPERFGKPAYVYMGVARTHYAALVFHEGADPARLEAQFAGLRHPLLALAPPKWYCRDTKVFGPLAESNPDIYKPEWLPVVKRYDEGFERVFRKFSRMMDGRKAGGTVRDDYGLLEWGDNFHYTKEPKTDDPYIRKPMPEWNGNYYDYPHMMCMQFCRTGNLGYFDHFDAHSLHVADVHTVHWDSVRNGFWQGANRYCPPGEHVRFDDGPKDRYPVYVSDTFNHHKSQCLFERWYFLADHRMLDVLGEIEGLVMRYKGGDTDANQPRGPAHLMITLTEFYKFSGGDKKYLTRAGEVWRKNERASMKNGQPHYQIGFMAEAMARYHEISGNPDVRDFLRDKVSRFVRSHPSGNVAYGAAHYYGMTGDAKFLDFAVQCLPGGDPSGDPTKEKDFAMMWRNAMYVPYWLTREASPPEPGAGGAEGEGNKAIPPAAPKAGDAEGEGHGE